MIALLVLALLPAANTRADERFTLAIADKTIARGPYDESLEVGIDRPVSVHVGVAVHADRIRIELRGITGDVRFRADLSPVTNVIDRHSQRTKP